MLLSRDWHVGPGLQSSTVELLLTPLVKPMYWFKLFCEVLVSYQSANTVQFWPASLRNGMNGSANPMPPTSFHVRFSSTTTTMWSYLVGGAVAVAPHFPAIVGYGGCG